MSQPTSRQFQASLTGVRQKFGLRGSWNPDLVLYFSVMDPHSRWWASYSFDNDWSLPTSEVSDSTFRQAVNPWVPFVTQLPRGVGDFAVPENPRSSGGVAFELKSAARGSAISLSGRFADGGNWYIDLQSAAVLSAYPTQRGIVTLLYVSQP